MLGFDGCVKLLVELGTYVDWSASVTEGALEQLAAAKMSDTCPHAPPPRTDWQRIAEQEGMNGGAATSKTHTAVKIAPHYSGPVINCLNASESLVVCSALTDNTTREAFLADISEEYEEVRQEHYETLKDRRFTPIDVARSKAFRVDFDKFPRVRPTLIRRREFLDFDLNKLIPYIDWKPFFDDAQKWLNKIIKEEKLKANAVIGFYEAGSHGDDIHVFENGVKIATFYGLRGHDQHH